MAQNKYVLLKSEDANAFLNPQQKQVLLEILSTVAEGRRRAGKTVGDLFFVLNMKDQYAQAAIEEYIAAIQRDDVGMANTNVQAALDTALSVRRTAMMNLTPRMPD